MYVSIYLAAFESSFPHVDYGQKRRSHCGTVSNVLLQCYDREVYATNGTLWILLF